MLFPATETKTVPRRLKVAVAEDDDHLRAALVEALTDEGFDVLPLEDGAELNDYFSMNLRQWADAIVADLNMPGRSGLDGLELARQRGLTVPIFVVSGESPEKYHDRIAKLGNALFFSKPVAVDRLARAIREVAGVRATET